MQLDLTWLNPCDSTKLTLLKGAWSRPPSMSLKNIRQTRRSRICKADKKPIDSWMVLTITTVAGSSHVIRTLEGIILIVI